MKKEKKDRKIKVTVTEGEEIIFEKEVDYNNPAAPIRLANEVRKELK